MAKTFDKSFAVIVASLILFGFLVFSSASLGLLVNEELSFKRVVGKQAFFGLVGIGALILMYKINYRKWRKYSPIFFILSLILTAAVFLPNIGVEHGGAKRWLSLFGVSFQPAELLKFAFVLYFAAWLSAAKTRINDLRFGLLPMIAFLSIMAIILLAQPNTGLFIIIFIAALAMFIVAGGHIKHLLILGLVGLMGLSLLIYMRPYVRERLITFINPSEVNPLREGYQIRQSLIAIGSGGIFGRGLGQSIQKFDYLPEPIGDSIFAVAAEEFGLIGSYLIVLLFLALSLVGLKIASRAPDAFGRLSSVGIVILITSQSFINIGAMLGLFPISGIPILFISQGGTALFFTLVEAGFILNVSKYQV